MALIVEIVNKSDLADVSDYEYRVRINNRIIRKGNVFGHARKDGFLPLLKMVVEDLEEQCLSEEDLALTWMEFYFHSQLPVSRE